MKIWKSVVGKLWITILLLVSFVLFVLTILLLEFFQNYHVDEVEKELMRSAEKVSTILAEHSELVYGLEIVDEIIDSPSQVIITDEEGNRLHATKSEELVVSNRDITSSPMLSKVFDGETVTKEIRVGTLSGSRDRYENVIVSGTPYNHTDGKTYGVFVFQSLQVLKQTTQQTTQVILLAAGIAIILTTIFAFFLSTRITAPLRKMREAAFEVSKGNFSSKVPILTNDEIGELATAFNQMGRQITYHIHALNQEKEQLFSILSSMADGVITINRDGTVLITNPPADRFLEQAHYEKEGEAFQAVPKDVVLLFSKVMETEKEQFTEMTVQGRTYMIVITPLYNEQSVRGAVAVLRDMTEERKHDVLRKDFIANVSHELRTPISMLQGYSEAIMDDIAGTDEEKKEFAKIIYDESLRMGRLVNDLLDLARMEAGYQSISKEDVPIASFIERISLKFQGVARESSVQLSTENALLGSVWADPDRLEQVFTNLIDNALRHTPEGGNVKIKSSRKGSNALFEVQDSGQGIHEDDLPFVFERFYKADKARTRGKSGTGLGLAIVKNIIHAHGGSIEVRSKLGQGTTFIIELPIKMQNERR